MIEPGVWGCIGASLPDGEAMDQLVEAVQRNALATVEIPIGSYTTWMGWTDDEDLWLAFYVVEDDYSQVCGLHPHFSGKGRLNVTIDDRLPVNEEVPLTGCMHASLAGEEFSSATWPLVFHVPDFGRYLGAELPAQDSLQVAAFAYAVEIYPDLAGFENAMQARDPDERSAPHELLPAGYWGDDGQRVADPPPFVQVAGEVLEAQRIKNTLTGQFFWWALVETAGGTVDALFSLEQAPNGLAVGNMVFGTFCLSGAPEDLPADESVEDETPDKHWRLDRDRLREAYQVHVQSPAFRAAFDRTHPRPVKRFILAGILALTCVSIPISIGLVIGGMRKRKNLEALFRRYQELGQVGEPILAFIVIANSALFRQPNMDAPALAVGSFGGTVSSGVMTEAALRLCEAYGVDPTEVDGEEQELAQLMENDAYEEGKRRMVPAWLSDGREIIAFDLMIHSDFLPTDMLVHPFIPCLADPRPGGLINMLPWSLAEFAIVESAAPPPMPDASS